MSVISLESVEKTAMAAAFAAGARILEIRNSGSFSVGQKADQSLVTTADLASEQIIIEIIRKNFSSHNILAEESAPQYNNLSETSGPLWIIDPVDGTTNYARGHNHVGVSIAFAMGREVQFAVVHAPFQNETFSAMRGKGAYLNGKAIEPSNITDLSAALVATGFPHERPHLAALAMKAKQVLAHCMDIRRLGAASIDISWVACGRLDAYYEDVKPWDMAAAGLIAREAGACVNHIADEAGLCSPAELCGQGIVVSSPGIKDSFLKIMAE